jgi:SAM-dependent methyltransferase
MVKVLEKVRRVEVEEGPPRYPARELLARTRRALFRGDGVECSCCGGTFSHFLYSPYFTARCPYCLSIERYRLLCRYLRDETDFGRRQMNVLDIAPMWCFQEFCRSFGDANYLSIDLASPLAMRRMDIRGLALDDSTYDWLFCYHVLEHIDDEQAALGELYRVLKPGGRAVIQVPIDVERTVERSSLTPAEQTSILRWPGHLRAYGTDYADRLRRARFEVEVLPFVRRFSEEDLERYGLDATEDLFICTK